MLSQTDVTWINSCLPMRFVFNFPSGMHFVIAVISLLSVTNCFKSGGRLVAEYNKIEGIIIAAVDCETFEYENEAHKIIIREAVLNGVKVLFQFDEEYQNECRKLIEEALEERKDLLSEVISITSDYTPSLWTRDYAPDWLMPIDYGTITAVSLVKSSFSPAAVDYIKSLPGVFKEIAFKHANLEDDGGNIVYDDDGLCVSTKLIMVENDIDEETVARLYSDIYNCKETILMEMLPYDMTKHADIFLAVARKKVLFFGWYDEGTADKDTIAVMNANYELLENNKFIKENNYKLFKVPMPPLCELGNLKCVGKKNRDCPFAVFKKRSKFSPQCTLRSLSKCSAKVIREHYLCSNGRRNVYPYTRSYLNYAFINGEKSQGEGSVLVPVYRSLVHYEDTETVLENLQAVERKALEIIENETKKKIITIPAERIAYQGGGIHCMTKQVSKGLLFK
jgi:agmatine/peptidylarginine deiminase